MKRAALVMVDLRGQIREELRNKMEEAAIPVSVRKSWPREAAEGVIITYQEYDNRSTDCPVVDYVEYQIDLWAFDRQTVHRLAAEVNEALMGIGLRRTYMGPTAPENGTYERKTMRFGRNVDKRWLRAIDL